MKQGFRVLLVEDDPSFRGAVLQLLGVYNDVDATETLAQARAALRATPYEIVILDKQLPDGSGVDLIPEIKTEYPNAVVIILTGDSDFQTVKRCMIAGADDYVVKSGSVIPDLLVRIPVAVSRAAADRKLSRLEDQLKKAFRYELVGVSPESSNLRANILGLRGSRSAILVTGETGTGKELVARMLHAIEEDQDRPFVSLNCGAIPENLIESELFGHKKGAFTSAIADRPGQFELAHRGDLFLDEVGELSLSAQVKLLRVLQEGEFKRVGGDRPIAVSCRVIAATNQDIEELVRKKRFRDDLYYRLNVVRIHTAPLRARRDDIEPIVKSMLVQLGGPRFEVSVLAMKLLVQHDWPGNVRELRNTIERALLSAKRRASNRIEPEDISIQQPLHSAGAGLRRLEAVLPTERHELSEKGFREFIDLAEKEYLQRAVELCEANVAAAAAAIGLGRTTMYRKLVEHGLMRGRPAMRASSADRWTETGRLPS